MKKLKNSIDIFARSSYNTYCCRRKPVNEMYVLLSWIERQATDQKVVGSNPVTYIVSPGDDVSGVFILHFRKVLEILPDPYIYVVLMSC